MTLRRKRILLTVTAVVPVALLTTALAFERDAPGAISSTPCWVLPNATVLVMPGDSDCPLYTNDRIVGIVEADGIHRISRGHELVGFADNHQRKPLKVVIVRGDDLVRVELPLTLRSNSHFIIRHLGALLAVSALLALPLFILWRTDSASASPLVLFYASLTIIVVADTIGRQSAIGTYCGLAALAAAPATLAHLGMVFPPPRTVLRDAPSLVFVPYLLWSILVSMGWMAFDNNLLLWPALTSLVQLLTAAAWGSIVLACFFAIRESRSAVERLRARVVLWGSILGPIFPTLSSLRPPGDTSEAIIFYSWIASAMMPVPIGIAISRYDLFNLGPDVRLWIGRIIYVGFAALVISLTTWIALWASDVELAVSGWAVLIGSFALSVTAIEKVRESVMDRLARSLSPHARHIRCVARQFEDDAFRLCEDEEICRRLVDGILDTLQPANGCVFLGTENHWIPALPFGAAAPSRVSLLEVALRALNGSRIFYTSLLPGGASDATAALEYKRVEIAVSIDSGGQRLGVLLLGPKKSRRPYSGSDRRFLVSVAGYTGIALRNARTAKELLAAERHATTGRVAVRLAHEIEKDVDWMRRLLRTLPRQLDDRELVERDIDILLEFSEEIGDSVRRFVRESMQPIDSTLITGIFNDIVDQAIRRVERIHGARRIERSIEPRLSGVRCNSGITLVMTNLLDNALRASEPSDSVRVFATFRQECIQIEIIDRGSGMAADVLSGICQPGISRRDDGTGSGMGLHIASEILSELGGELQLESKSGQGTRAIVRIPKA